MKKYRVVTDSLDWYGVKRETILHEHIDNFYSFLPGSVAGHPVRNQYDIYSAIAAHPEWFSEIKEEEEPKEFTKKDMERAFNAGEMRGDYLAAENGIRMLGKMVPFEFWFYDNYLRKHTR